MCDNEIQAIQYKWKCTKSHLYEENEIYVKSLQNMLNKFDIDSNIIKHQNKYSHALDKQQRYSFGIMLYKCPDFIDKIGFRYSMSKQIKAISASTLWKMRKYLHNKEYKDFKLCSEYTNTQWLKNIEAKSFLEKGTYIISRNDEHISTMFIPIYKIEKSEIKSVYDISVENTHSFVANGIVVHNCGNLYSQEDMPYTKDGLTPDLIINPHAIPSRMTIGQIIECIVGKACIQLAKFSHSTPFCDISAEDIIQILEELGLEPSADEIMYNPKTGEQMKCKIFYGPTYYQRLKHIASDKIHSRSNNGPVVLLTRQPAEGRSREGGLRMGEMEVDCNFASGIFGFLKERMMDCSDNYRIFICNICKKLANVNSCKFCGMITNSQQCTKCGKNATIYHDKNIAECKGCKNYTQFTEIRVPYAFKLLMQEVNSLNIVPRFNTHALTN